MAGRAGRACAWSDVGGTAGCAGGAVVAPRHCQQRLRRTLHPLLRHCVALTATRRRQDVEDRVSLDMCAAAAAIHNTRVLTMHGSADTTIPLEDGREFQRRIAGSELVAIEGADHNFVAEPRYAQELIEAVVGWLVAQGAPGRAAA